MPQTSSRKGRVVSSTRLLAAACAKSVKHLGTFTGALLLLLVITGCGPEPSSPGTTSATAVTENAPVIIVSIDTLRSDRLPAYGYQRIETPAIDAFAADSTLFENAWTHMSLTLPSHVSILSGEIPVEHGVRDNLGYQVAPETELLSESLGSKGYETAGFVSSYVLRAATGIDQGFGTWDDEVPFESSKQLGGLQRPGLETLARTTAWLDETLAADPDRPFFLFFHIYEPHSPYAPSEPFASRYDNPYDAEVAESDDIVGRLFEDLQKRGVYDDALIVLLSDHGEGLMDHGEMDHLIFVYREALQVPLLIKLPLNRGAGERVSDNVQLTDVYPTIRAALGLEKKPTVGVDLFGERDRLTSERTVFSESIYPRVNFGWSDLASMIRDRFHYIDAPRPELYDLALDPFERTNIVGDHPALVSDLRSALRGIDRTIEGPGEVDAETKAQLAALGYIGSNGGAIPEGDLADPKDKIEVMGLLHQADTLLRRADLPRAIAAYERIVAQEPDMLHAWKMLARARHQAGQLGGAAQAYERALAISGGAPTTLLNLSILQFEMGEVATARAGALLAVDTVPAAHALLARIAIEEGELEEAERHVQAAREVHPDPIEASILEISLRNERGQHQEALDLATRTEREFGARADREVLHTLFSQSGTALGKLGRFEEAKAAYQKAIEASDQAVSAYAALAFLLALEGDGPAAGRTLEAMVQANDNPLAYAEAVRTLQAMQDPDSAQRLLLVARQRWPDAEALRLR